MIRTRILVTALVLLVTSSSGAQVIDKRPLYSNQTRHYQQAYFWAPERGYVVTSREILRTTDGGSSWRLLREFPKGEEILRLFFLDEQRFWLYTAKSLYRTTDGLANLERVRVGFQRLDTDTGALGAISPDLQFLDEAHGWSVDVHHVVQTEDGGQTWRPVMRTRRIGDIVRVWMFSETEGFVLTDQGVYRTIDGWRKYTLQPGSPARLDEVQCQARFCVATARAEFGKTVFFSSDAGLTWQVQQPGFRGPRDEPRNFQILSPNRVKIYGTDVGFDKLEDLLFEREGQLRQRSAQPTSFILTWDGTAWSRLNVPTIASIGYVQFVDDQHAWAVAGENNIFRSDDGGHTWYTVQDYFRRQVPAFLRPLFGN